MPAAPSASPGILLEVQNLSPPQAHWVRNLHLTSTQGDLGEQRSSPKPCSLQSGLPPAPSPGGRKVRPPGPPEAFCLLLCVYSPRFELPEGQNHILFNLNGSATALVPVRSRCSIKACCTTEHLWWLHIVNKWWSATHAPSATSLRGTLFQTLCWDVV